MPMPDFKDEAEFRTKWIAPFLSKLGYIQVSHIHGAGEQGKDFFFADFDRFEHRRFYAVQAKVGKIGAGGKELDELLNQVKRCFSVKLRFHKEADEKRICAVYLMASGSISREAREYITDWCRSNCFGENVYYLDGDTLERLDKHAFQRIDLDLRNRFLAVMAECGSNMQVIEACQALFAAKKSTFYRCRLSALDALLIAMPPQDLFDYALAQNAWRHLSLLNTYLDTAYGFVTISGEAWETRRLCAQGAVDLTLRLRDAALAAIEALDKRYSISVEVVPEPAT